MSKDVKPIQEFGAIELLILASIWEKNDSTNAEIAKAIHYELSTVKNYLAKIYLKLDLGGKGQHKRQKLNGWVAKQHDETWCTGEN